MRRNVEMAASEEEKVSIPYYIIISFLTIFAIGPQYFLNLAYTVSQGIVQTGLNISSRNLLTPSIISNLAFSLGVPLGPVFSRKLGLRKNYLTFIFVFLCGSVIGSMSFNLVFFSLGRVIQGLSAGFLFLTILPVSLRSFPNKIRNTFLLMVIIGLFGASAVGAFFGSISLSVDAWRWLFYLSVLSSILCLIVGFLGLPKHDEHANPSHPINFKAMAILVLAYVVLAFPLCQLIDKGLGSAEVWPLFTIGLVLLSLFVYFDQQADLPIVPFKTLLGTKPISGTVMAVASHATLVVAIAGMNGFLRNNRDLPIHYLAHFYLFFYLGIVITAILKTLLYDALGAGKLGLIGSLAVFYVGFQWRVIGPHASLSSLYFQIAILGAGVSMVLVSGALGTALAGDIHKASYRSATLHTIRNFVGAIASPFIGWYLTKQNAINYESIRGAVDSNNPEIHRELITQIQSFVQQGLSLDQSKSMAAYNMVANAKKSAILGAYHNIFLFMMILSVIMFLASIGKTVTGKGTSLVQKKKVLPSHQVQPAVEAPSES
ncbi:MAG TPA: MFS transporter [Candidatus Angelobacter sp.]|nr:MFS transporter [Candidatus Angelobacter sp.]